MSGPVVGFDLDMTLIDSRPGIRATYEALVAEHVRVLGGRTVVVTAKSRSGALAHLESLGLPVDALESERWHTEKAAALLAHGATVMVGDHVADMAGALAAGVVAVGVTTGSSTAAELTAAGATVVLASLEELPAWLDEHVLNLREQVLLDLLRAAGSVLVAFSGGADSALVLAAAVRALGTDRVAAATGVSDSLAADELAGALAVCDELGVRLLTPQTHEMERAGYRANGGDRCSFCKAELLDVLTAVAADLGLASVATGTNADDVSAGFRPGIRAAAERGAVTPLADAGLTKAQVRELSRRWGLRTWDKPAAACLSSRIAYGVEVTPHRLARVERAEAGVRAALRTAGLRTADLRVRDLGDRASVELDGGLVDRAATLSGLLDAVRTAGFAAVDVDPRGFRSGSMNERLPDAAPAAASGTWHGMAAARSVAPAYPVPPVPSAGALNVREKR